MRRMNQIIHLGGRGTSSSGTAAPRAAAAAAAPSPPPSPRRPTSSTASTSTTATAPTAAAQSNAARGMSNKTKYDPYCYGLVGKFRTLALLDKILVLAVLAMLGVEIHAQIKTYRTKHASSEEGGDASAAAAGKGGLPLWATRFIVLSVLLFIVGGIAYCCRRCYLRRRARSATSHLRTRGGGDGLSSTSSNNRNCCTLIIGFWKRLGILDKALIIILLCFGTADLIMTAREHDVSSKLKTIPGRVDIMLRGTPAPTSAPTPVPPPPPEDVASVVSAMEARAGPTAKAPPPPQCTDDEYARIKSSGMVGDSCRGQPFTQACATSQLTRSYQPNWLMSSMDFVDDIRTDRARDVNGTLSLLGVVLGDPYGTDCSKGLEDFLPDDDTARTELLKSPKLLCNSKFYVADDIKTKWGVDGSQGSVTITSDGESGGKTADVFLRDSPYAHEIKDVVKIVAAPKALTDGTVTFARSRYVAFQYDWQGGWSGIDLRGVVDTMDGVGHTCYWPGVDKLWRITNCWQDFYGYKTYSFVVCVNRNLAPKLHEKMEGVFKKTIGA